MDSPEHHESAIELQSIGNLPGAPVIDTAIPESEHDTTRHQQTNEHQRRSDCEDDHASSSDVEAFERRVVEPNNRSNAEHNTQRRDSAAQDQDQAGGFNALERQ